MIRKDDTVKITGGSAYELIRLLRLIRRYRDVPEIHDRIPITPGLTKAWAELEFGVEE